MVGYNDQTKTITTADPWDRDGQPQHYTVSEADFLAMWNYQENKPSFPYGEKNPYVGIIVSPFHTRSVLLTPEGGSKDYILKISGSAQFYCPKPFKCISHYVTNVIAGLQFKSPPSANLSVTPMLSQRVGSLAAAMNVTVTWKLLCMTPNLQACYTEASKLGIGVSWRGILAERVGPVYCCGENTVYPAYEYTDVIGTSLDMQTRQLTFDPFAHNN